MQPAVRRSSACSKQIPIAGALENGPRSSMRSGAKAYYYTSHPYVWCQIKTKRVRIRNYRVHSAEAWNSNATLREKCSAITSGQVGSVENRTCCGFSLGRPACHANFGAFWVKYSFRARYDSSWALNLNLSPRTCSRCFFLISLSHSYCGCDTHIILSGWIGKYRWLVRWFEQPRLYFCFSFRASVFSTTRGP